MGNGEDDDDNDDDGDGGHDDDGEYTTIARLVSFVKNFSRHKQGLMDLLCPQLVFQGLWGPCFVDFCFLEIIIYQGFHNLNLHLKRLC